MTVEVFACRVADLADGAPLRGPAGSGPGIVALVKNADGTLTTLATSATAPALYSPTTYLPALNGTGRAAYIASGGSQIAIAPLGTTSQ